MRLWSRLTCAPARPRGDSPGDARAVLLAVVAEARPLQEAAAELLDEIRHEGPLAELAPRGGPVMTRFLELRRRLPITDEPDLAGLVACLDQVFHHHAYLLNVALDTLAVSWRSERVREQLRLLDGLGEPGQRLRDIHALLLE